MKRQIWYLFGAIIVMVVLILAIASNVVAQEIARKDSTGALVYVDIKGIDKKISTLQDHLKQLEEEFRGTQYQIGILQQLRVEADTLKTKKR